MTSDFHRMKLCLCKGLGIGVLDVDVGSDRKRISKANHQSTDPHHLCLWHDMATTTKRRD